MEGAGGEGREVGGGNPDLRDARAAVAEHDAVRPSLALRHRPHVERAGLREVVPMRLRAALRVEPEHAVAHKQGGHIPQPAQRERARELGRKRQGGRAGEGVAEIIL